MQKKIGPVGPCISGVIDLRNENEPLQSGNIIEDMAIPGAFGPVYYFYSCYPLYMNRVE